MKNLDQLNQEFMAAYPVKEAAPAKPKQKAPTSKAPAVTPAPTAAPAPAYQPLWKDLLALAAKIAAIALAFVLMFTFVFGLMRYLDPAMAPTIKDGDLVIFYRHVGDGYLPQDTVALEVGGMQHVRRVIAVAGDTVDITDDGLLINGGLQFEPHITEVTRRYQEGIDFPLTVPEGSIFVLGDSREGATDSRVYGTVRIEDTLGKVITVVRRRNI